MENDVNVKKSESFIMDYLLKNGFRFVNPEEAFKKCLRESERSDYMYMYSKENRHYFKNIVTREYRVIKKRGLITVDPDSLKCEAK